MHHSIEQRYGIEDGTTPEAIQAPTSCFTQLSCNNVDTSSVESSRTPDGKKASYHILSAYERDKACKENRSKTMIQDVECMAIESTRQHKSLGDTQRCTHVRSSPIITRDTQIIQCKLNLERFTGIGDSSCYS